MKRFYRSATADPDGMIRLDGKPVMTPARRPLALPGAGLAHAIAAEWAAQGDRVDPRAMPLTGLANAAIDRIGPDCLGQARRLGEYAQTDLLYYRAEGPEALVARQRELWDPIIAWARARYGVDFEVIVGIVHRPQPRSTIERLSRAVAELDAFTLAGLTPLVTISGSLVLALALLEGATGVDAAWAAASLDEHWQLERWGEDSEAAQALALREGEFRAAARFLALL